MMHSEETIVEGVNIHGGELNVKWSAQSRMMPTFMSIVGARLISASREHSIQLLV